MLNRMVFRLGRGNPVSHEDAAAVAEIGYGTMQKEAFYTTGRAGIVASAIESR
jgi:hypothetical protein